MLEIYGRATSSNVQAVMWLVGELGLEHRRHDYGHAFGGLDTPAFRAMNPHGLIPVIRDGDGPPIWESMAILRYLAARHGAEAVWPADPAARAQVDMWAEWVKGSVCRLFTVPVFWAVVRTAPSARDPARIARAVDALNAELAKADARLGGQDWLAADRLTLADIALGHILYRYFDIDIARPEMPALRRYYDRLTERPGYREHVMIDYKVLRVTD